jgi:ADP-heptose:LPS heptosyltransferase
VALARRVLLKAQQAVTASPLSAVRSIVVFRALMLGDWLCATPALRALRAAAPRARIVLCGLPWTAALAGRLPMVDDFLPFPGHPALPEKAAAAGSYAEFLARARVRRFDLALQMHGSGNVVNGIVAALGARMAAGFATPGTEDGLDIGCPWPAHGHEIDRCLALADAVGAPAQGRTISFPLCDADRHAAMSLLASAGVCGEHVIVHPGAQLPSRRWAPARFAAVADALADQGMRVVITGSADEADLARAVRAAMRNPAVDLCGRTTSVWTLGALVERAALVVANDTGVSHVAAALRTPSVIVASGSDVARWAPLDRTRHRVLWHPVACRPCAHPACPTAHECAAGVTADAVAGSALDLLETIRPCPTPLAASAS